MDWRGLVFRPVPRAGRILAADADVLRGIADDSIHATVRALLGAPRAAASRLRTLNPSSAPRVWL
jgi:hypothetical protein